MDTRKVVLCFSGLDATGGAGIQADIEALGAMGCHAAPVVTALTVQDTRQVQSYEAVDSHLLIQQARAVLEDMPVAAIKIGMIGSSSAAQAIHSILRDYPDLPVIYDPVMAGGGGGNLAESTLLDAIKALVLPLCYLITPNTLELQQLATEADTLDAAAMELLDMGITYLLVTGTHNDTRDVQHQLFANHRCVNRYSYPRLEQEYHGSGCTLAASLAGLIAQGHETSQAVHRALDYTYKTLQQAQRLGMGQLIPDRYYWNTSDQS
ncbi:MAG: hydroxymethylpyrimidine/phosphomethylpyrimidine kinase [Gammaproteobacteria bacterium]|nr:MAG: hydroxymethylpyrimidine/phosphomethylpyrimidine kinase [Gammaproteobacteria bacterium]